MRVTKIWTDRTHSKKFFWSSNKFFPEDKLIEIVFAIEQKLQKIDWKREKNRGKNDANWLLFC